MKWNHQALWNAAFTAAHTAAAITIASSTFTVGIFSAAAGFHAAMCLVTAHEWRINRA